MPHDSKRVTAFFEQYERSIAASDPLAVAALYADSFIFSGPQGVQAVKREDFVRVLPKRRGYFESLGLQSTTIAGVEETGLDAACALAKVRWTLRFAAPAASTREVEVSTMYLLQQHADGLRIVFQHDYDDLTKRVQELGPG